MKHQGDSSKSPNPVSLSRCICLMGRKPLGGFPHVIHTRSVLGKQAANWEVFTEARPCGRISGKTRRLEENVQGSCAGYSSN